MNESALAIVYYCLLHCLVKWYKRRLAYRKRIELSALLLACNKGSLPLKLSILEMPCMSTMSNVTSNAWPDLYAVCPTQNGLSMVVQPSSFLSASHPISVTASQSISMLSPAIASGVPASDLAYWMPHSCFHTMPTASSGGALMTNYNFVPVYSQLTAEPITGAYGPPHIATTGGHIQLFNPLMNSTK